VVGEFVSKTDLWRGKPVSYYVRKKYEDRMDNSFGNTLRMLDFFSDRIGVEYPWDKYTQVCCYQFGGGMENTSSTTLGERTLHDDRAHLDTSSDGLVAHELAHQWWGDLLTCREWAHLWLNEGFASYFEALWAEEDLGAEEFALNMSRKARGAISGGKSKPIVYREYDHPGEQFDSRAYPKGAWVLHMIRRRLGDDMFWKAIHTYCTRHRHSSVETVDLRKAIEDVSGRSFERFFHDWTERPGHPKVSSRYQWLADDKLARIEIEQTQETDAFYFPLKLEFRFAEDAAPRTVTLDIREKQTSFYIPLARRPKLFRIDPDQAVLMELKRRQPRDLWVAQLTADPNPVARIEAAGHLAGKGTDADLRLLATRLREDGFWAVQAAIARELGKAKDDLAREALLAAVSTEHPKARAAIVEALGHYPDDEAVESALLRIIKIGDASYRVETRAIDAYAKVCDEPPRDFLASLLDRDSQNETGPESVIELIASGPLARSAIIATPIDSAC
ncbi:MAG: M1 family aminopeptidase, partial [Phycisphaerae bacterium]